MAGIAFAPDQKIFPLGVARPSGGEQLGEMPPINENVMDRAVAAAGDGLADERGQEGGERRFGHLARGHFEFSMALLTPPHRMAVDGHIIRRVCDDHLGEIAFQHEVVFFASQASPHNKRWRSSCQTSPDWLTARPSDVRPVRSLAGSSVASPGLPSTSRSISPVEKPVSSTSKSTSISSVKCPRSKSKSHTA